MPEPNTGCFLWTGTTTGGYGRVRRGKRTHYAHRVAYELLVGPIPEGMCVLHRCDTPPCVNPAHLFLGTIADNNQDMVQKGRGIAKSGEQHCRARLTEDDVLAIRARAAAGETQRPLAREYGVDQATISNIVTRKSWKHVQDSEVERTP